MTTKAKTIVGGGMLMLLLVGVIVFEIKDWFSNGDPTASSPRLASSSSPPATQSALVTAEAGNYTADLSGGVPANFSGGVLRVTRLQSRPYISETAGSQPITFTLPDLPKHNFVHATFDLVLFNSWDGCNAYWGADVWICGLEGGPELLRTSFSNCGMFQSNNEQNYPDTFPLPTGATPHPAWTGVLEHGTLGDMHSWGQHGPDETFDCSAIYHMDWTFPHTDSTLRMNFSKAKKSNKTYGFLNFHVDALPAANTLSDAQFKQAWADVNSEDSIAANAAVWRLIGAGDASVQMLEGKDLSELNDFPCTRVRHILQVINSEAANKLATKLPALKESLVPARPLRASTSRAVTTSAS